MTDPSARQPSRRWLYIPFILFALLIIAYSAYWFWMRGQLEQGIDQWIDEQRTAGLEINYDAKRIDGFPYRFALKVDAPHIRQPATGLDWKGEELQLIMQPWNFQHLMGRSPGRNELALPGGEPVTAILGRKSIASLSWTSEQVRRFAVALDTADIVTAGGDVSLKDFSLNAAPTPDDPASVRLAVDWGGVDLPVAPPAAEWLGPSLSTGTVRVELGQIMRTVAGERLTSGPDIDLAQLIVNWGPLKLGAKGDVSLIDFGCRLDGIINVRLEDTAALAAALERAGQLTDEIEAGINAVGGVSQNGGFAPITIDAGQVTFLGQAVAELPTLCPVSTEATR